MRANLSASLSFLVGTGAGKGGDGLSPSSGKSFIDQLERIVLCFV
jgi:hypothetical protein